MRTNKLLLLLCAAAFAAGCAKNEPETPQQPSEDTPAVSFKDEISKEHPYFVLPQEQAVLALEVSNADKVTVSGAAQGWSAEIDTEEMSLKVTASQDATVMSTFTVTATSLSGQSAECDVLMYCVNSFDDPRGAFVLNEGNMTTENGSLTYITPEGYVIDDAYKFVNGTELGNVAQDMAFYDGKIYVISQNGDGNAVGGDVTNDGMLVIADAKTLKKIKSFTRQELSGLDWPSHIAVLDESHIYIRDNAGISRFDAASGSLTFIEGSEGAPKSRFVTMNGKVYTHYLKSYMGGLYEISAESDAVTKYSFPFKVDVDINEVLGIAPASDNEMWVMTFGFGKTAIGRFNFTDKKIVQRQISIKPSVGSSGIAFAACGNDMYYADGTTIYTMKFDDSEDLTSDSGIQAEKYLCDLNGIDPDAGILYNGLAVHPVTSHVYINTIKSFAQYTKNQIWVFDFASGNVNPVAKYGDYTNFPAGTFFCTQN